MLRIEDHLCVQYYGRLLRLCTSGVVDLLLTSDQPSPDLVELEEMPSDLIFDPEDVSGLLLWALWRPFSALIVLSGPAFRSFSLCDMFLNHIGFHKDNFFPSRM